MKGVFNMANTKFYAVKEGRTTGIFLTWEECQKQVNGHPGALYKSFPTKEEALAYLNNQEIQSPTSSESATNLATPYAFVDGSYNITTKDYGYGGFLQIDEETRITLQGKGNDTEKASMRNVAGEISYAEMNEWAGQVPIGSEGVCVLPFGNGVERMLENREVGCSMSGLNFNRHDKRHIIRAAQEGIVFSFKYGIDIMSQMGISVQKIHAGYTNMFLSPIFRDTLSGVTGATIELYDTDGSVGAAKGAGIGAGIYKDNNEAFATLEKLDVIEPNQSKRQEYLDAYARWKHRLEKSMRD